MFRPALLAIPLAVAACATAGVAFADDGPAAPGRSASAAAPPAGELQLVLRPASFRLADVPPKRSGDGPPSPGDASIITYRVSDASGGKLGRAQFVCVAVDRRGRHEQCTGTIALPDGQIATQGDAAHVAVVGGTGAYAGARGTATGEDDPDSVDVTVHFIP